MSMIDVTFLTAATVTQAAQQPRAVTDAAAQQFREALTKSDCATEACSGQPTARSGMPPELDFDFEKVVISQLPSPSASPAEFAVGLLRAQIEVGKMALTMELVSKTTQSLSQGVQALTMRS